MQRLQVKTRQAVMTPPRNNPYRLMAWWPYTEQVGLRRHRPRVRFGFCCHASIVRSTASFMAPGQKLNSFEMSMSGHWPGLACQGSLHFSWTGST